MATIGQQLTQPEAGWKRYDDTHPLIKYNGVWMKEINANYSNGSSMYSEFKNTNCSIKFVFKGTKIRIFSPVYNNKPNDIPITIDGITETYGSYNPTIIYTPTLVYEKTGLEMGIHTVEIKTPLSVASITNGNIQLDCIDIDADGELTILQKRLAIKNPTTNQHYSLADKTLITLPNASDKNMILHGIEAGKEIQLDEAFDKIQYVNELSTATNGESGKIMTMDLLAPTTKILKINEVR